MDTHKPARFSRRCLWLCGPLLLSFAAQAQCINEWLPGDPGFSVPGSRSLIEWDPDGAGPLSKVLVIAGTNAISIWDGSQLSTLGTGLFDIRYVTIFNGSLVVATKCPSSGTGGVYRWTGTFWESLGLGMGGVTNAYVQTLLPFQGKLIAGGGFFTADGLSASCVSQWDGVRWLPLGAGLNDSVWALAEYQGELIAAGTFSNTVGIPVSKIARWDGSFWQSLGDGVNNFVYSLAVRDSSLFASGTFTASGALAANRIAQWDGTQWNALGSGLSGQGTVLLDDDEGLLVGGNFATAGGVPTSNLARWDGAAWNAWTPGVSGPVLGLLRTPEHMYISGSFGQSLGRTIGATVTWDGQNFRRLRGGFNDRINTMIAMDGDVILGGSFTTFRDNIVSPVSRWNNGNMISIGNAPCHAWGLAVLNGDLFVAGPGRPPLTPTTDYNVWKWNGVSWAATGTGANAAIKCLGVYNNELIAGGSFSTINGVSARSVARYDGTSWAALAGGLIGLSSSEVTSLTVHGDNLIAAGTFNQSPGQPVALGSNIARWNGIAWTGFGTGTFGESASFVYCTLSLNGQLYIGGDLRVLNQVPVRCVGRWTGSTFEQVGGLTNGTVYAMGGYRNRLVISGFNLRQGTTTFTSPLTWDGSAWQQFGSGLGGTLNSGVPWSTATLNDELFMSGDFDTAGGAHSKWLARWQGTEPVQITLPPMPTSSCNHSPAQFSVQATGTSLQFHWQHNSIPIDVLQNPTAGTATLLIPFPLAADSGQYACSITNSCGTVLSSSASLTVCESDFNCDTTVDFFDYLDFVDSFAQGGASADFNNDTVIDFFDYLDFVDAFSAGC